jgi:hypothetical protein
MGDSQRITLGASSNAKGAAPYLTASETAAVRLYADDAGTAVAFTGSVGDVRNLLARLLLTTDHSANPVRLFASMGHLKGYNANWNTEQVAGVYGYLELARDTGTMTLSGYGKTSAGCFVVENSGALTVGTNHVLSGVSIISKITSDLTMTGVVAGISIGKYDTTNWSDSTARVNFPNAIAISAADNVLYFPTGSSYAAGVKIGSMTALGGATHTCSGLVRVNVAGTLYYMPLYAASEVTGE